jgi:hypothetical protein
VTDHLDLDALADLLADVDDASRAHLEGCPACSARLAELDAALPAVSASLAALPVPPEPADLAARLDAALRAEARATTPTATVVPLAARSRTRWLPALAGVAAAAVVVTGAVLVTQGGGGGDTADTAGTPLYATSATGTDYDTTTLAAAVPSLLAGTARPPSRVSGGTAGTAGSQYGPSPEADIAASRAVDALAPLRTTAGLASCLTALLDPASDDLPLALDYAAYQGTPALVVVLPGGQAEKVDVFVVGAGCAQADAQLLYFTRLPRP